MNRLILSLILCLPLFLFSQTFRKVPDFGKIEKADLENKTCVFDPEAEAVILMDCGKHYLDIRGEKIFRQMERHVRIKILKENGLSRANIKIPYYSFKNQKFIVNLTASTYNLDTSGNITITKLDKKQVYEKRLNPSYSEQSFSMPAVKVGSVIEYKYIVRGDESSHWDLQKDIPVVWSRFELNFPSNFELYIKPHCSMPYRSSDESSGLSSIRVFSMENIPAFREEKFMTCGDDYRQRIEAYVTAFHYAGRRYPAFNAWPEIANDVMQDDDFGKQLTQKIAGTLELDTELRILTDDYAKMVAIHNNVRKNMKWDGVDNIWAQNGVDAAWRDKKGTSGEINLILVNLLKKAGLDAFPILLRTRASGKITEACPYIGQFNKVMALVELNGKNYFLDGTDKYHPASLIPEDILYTDGFVIDPTTSKGCYWIQIREEKKNYNNTTLIQAHIDDKGMMRGSAVVSSVDYARSARMPHLKDKQEDYVNRFFVPAAGLTIDSLTFENEDNDTMALRQKFTFSGPINSSGDYSHFSANLFSELPTNPFISDIRFSDVFFGTQQNHTIIASFFIPEDYVFDEMPKNVRFTLEDKSIVVTRILAVTGKVLNARITLECKRSFYTPEEYPQLKEIYKKMYFLLDEHFVIKKVSS